MKRQQNHEEMFRLLQEALWEHGDISSLSEATGISNTTLYKYRRVGKKYPWPRYNTWQAIMPALGLQLELKRIKDEG